MGRKKGNGPDTCERPETWGIVLVIIGGLVVMTTMFIPRWRVDVQGTTALEEDYHFTVWMAGWKEKQYGLLQVQGHHRQSWSVVARSTCSWRGASGWMSFFSNVFQRLRKLNDTSVCEGSEQCSGGFFGHMNIRCEEYEKIWQLSNYTLSISIVACFAILVGVLLSILMKTRQWGGLVFTLFLFAGAAALIMNIVWAIATDVSFKRIMSTAWFPYPSLAMAWFLHLYGSITVLVGTAVFGIQVLPETMVYDAVEAKIVKKDRKIAKLRDYAEMQGQREQQALGLAQQQQQMPQMSPMQQVPQMQMQMQMQQVPQMQMQVHQVHQVHQVQQPLAYMGGMPLPVKQQHQGHVAVQGGFGLGSPGGDMQQVQLQMEPQPQAFGSPNGFGLRDGGIPQPQGQMHYQMPAIR